MNSSSGWSIVALRWSAHRQPWYFVAISDAELKAKIRAAAEAEEKDFYERRAPAAWLKAVFPLVYRQIRLPVFAVLAFVTLLHRHERDR